MISIPEYPPNWADKDREGTMYAHVAASFLFWAVLSALIRLPTRRYSLDITNRLVSS